MPIHRTLPILFLSLALFAQPLPTPAQASPKPDPFASIKFLLGTWSATTGAGTAQAKAIGTYTFRLDLAATVVTRISSAAEAQCSGPAAYDCQHQDALTIYQDQGDPTLHAIYFDNEGHTIHYNLTTPDANTAVFLSNSPGPQFRLTYHRDGNTMSGKFQVAPPGSSTFTSYLEWSGAKA